MTKRTDLPNGLYLLDFGNLIWLVAGGNVTGVDLLNDPDAHLVAECVRAYKVDGAPESGWFGVGRHDGKFGTNKSQAIAELRRIAEDEGPRYANPTQGPEDMR